MGLPNLADACGMKKVLRGAESATEADEAQRLLLIILNYFTQKVQQRVISVTFVDMNNEELERARQYVSTMTRKLIEEYNLEETKFYQTRQEPYPTIRELLWYRMYRIFDISTSCIGRMFKRNHATIIQGRRRAEWYLQVKDGVVAEIFEKILMFEKLDTMDKTDKVYISLPYIGTSEEMKAKAENAKNKFKAQGFTAIVVSTDLRREKNNEWLGARISYLLEADIIVFGNGWYDDVNCQLEKDACERFKKTHFTDGKI